MKRNAVEIKKDIYWVGALDWNIRNFHGYLTHRGSSYGAYLILDEKITLIDTVKAEFTEELLERIRSVVDPSQIDIIISNHVEMDHSGALPLLKKECPKAVVYTSGISGVKGLAAHYGEDAYQAVKPQEVLSIGKRSLVFVPTPMLHWPDNMVTYCPEEKILFSNDGFGQHLATSERTDEDSDLTVVMEEAKKYYANILMCYGKQAEKVIETVQKLEIEIIAPSHGVIWKEYIPEILAAYHEWSTQTPKDGAVVVFDSMWHATEKMAKVIAETFMDLGMRVRLYDLKENHPSDILAEILTSRYLAVGSPTLNNQMMPTVAAFLCYLNGLTPGDRQFLAFGSYGWGGQSISKIEQSLETCRFTKLCDSISVQYQPTPEHCMKIQSQIQAALI